MQYATPASVEEAVGLLSGDRRARPYAGSTDLIPQLRMGRPEPSLLVDLKRIPRLTDIRSDNGTWIIGAAAPAAALGENEGLSADLPGLVEAAALIGSDQIQSRASLGGNLCNASPAADSVPALAVNGARAVIAGPDGMRTVPAAEVATGPGTTALREGELLVEFEVDRPPPGTADAYLRFIPRTEMDIAAAGAAARIAWDGDGACAGAEVALGAVAPTVVRIAEAPGLLEGGPIEEEALRRLEEEAAAACDPIDDKRGTKQFRRRVAGTLARRAVLRAAQRAKERR